MDYEALNAEHSKLLRQIKQYEDERQEEPTDSIVMTCQLQPFLEETHEYVEDPKNLIATHHLSGRILRAKVKITLNYAPGNNPVSPYFRQIQLNIDSNKYSFYNEQSVFDFSEMSFEHSQTPQVI